MFIGTKCGECKGIGAWVGAGHMRKTCNVCLGTGLIKPKHSGNMDQMLGLASIGGGVNAAPVVPREAETEVEIPEVPRKSLDELMREKETPIDAVEAFKIEAGNAIAKEIAAKIDADIIEALGIQEEVKQLKEAKEPKEFVVHPISGELVDKSELVKNKKGAKKNGG